MAIINLLPAALGSFKKSKPKKGDVQVALKRSASIPILIAILLAGNWLLLSLQVKIKEKTLTALTNKLKSSQDSFQKIEGLISQKKVLGERLAFYKKFLKNRVPWSERLSLIAELIPEQIWLTQIYTEEKPAKILVLKGSATSLIETEIINSISQFLGKLKEDSSFSKDFSEIRLGALLTEKKGNLSIMNFTLNCKFRESLF